MKYALQRGLKLVVLFIEMIQNRFNVLHIDPIEEFADQPFLGIQVMFFFKDARHEGVLPLGDAIGGIAQEEDHEERNHCGPGIYD